MNEWTPALAARKPLAPLGVRGIARVLGWGTALPQYRYAQEDIAAWLASSLDPRRARRLGAAFRGSGIEFRFGCLPDFSKDCREPHLFRGAPPTTGARMSAYRDHAPALVCSAAVRALESARIAPECVTHLFTSTCTGFAAPGPDQDVIESLGLSPSVRRVLFGFQGCSAGVAALRTAAEIVRGDPEAVILVVAVELSSLHFQPSVPDEDLRGHALFADGAGAAVVAGLNGNPGNGTERGERRAVILERGASRLVPSTRDQMTWTVGDYGFLMRLGCEVPETLGAWLPDFVNELRDEVANEVADEPANESGDEAPELWAIHPGGPAILDRMESSLGLSPEDLQPSRFVLRRHGNMSSATIFFVFEEILRAERRGRGNALAFGPGLTIEGLRFHVA